MERYDLPSWGPVPRRALAAFLIAASVCTAACSSDPEVAKRQYAENGDRFAGQGKPREAIVEYRNAIAVDPRFGEARLKLADLYLQTKDVEGAVREYVRAADLLPQNLDAQVKASRALLRIGHFDDAAARADRTLRLDARHVEAHILKGNALAGLKDLDGAIQQIDEAIRTDPSSGVGYATLGAFQFAKGDTAKAESAFKSALRAAPGSIQAHLAIANFYWATNRRQDAEAALKAAVTIDGTSELANRALALFYLSTGRVAEAERPLAMVARSGGVPGRLALGDYYVRAERHADAKKVFEELATQPEGAVPAKLRLASVGLLTGEHDHARRLLADILAKEPNNPSALISHAQLQLADDQSDAALKTIAAAVAADPMSPRARYVLGQILAARQELDEATAAFKEALRLNPRFAPAAVSLARLSLAAGRPQESLQFARAAVDALPGYTDAQLALARAHIASNDIRAAEQPLRILKAAAPQSPAVQVEIARLHVTKGELEEARRAFERVLADDPFAADAFEGLLVIDLRQRRFAEARARLDSAVTVGARDAHLQLIAARAFAALGDMRAAERALKNALTSDPNNLTVYVELGRLYSVEQRIPEAIAEFEKASARQPRSVGLHTVIAVLRHLQNDVGQAEARYKQALEINSRAAVAANNLAWLYAEKGENLDIALQLAQTAKAELPTRHEIDDTLGVIYRMKGLSTLAVQSFQQSVRRDPRNPIYHYHLGLAYAQAGDKKRASESLRTSLTLKPDFDGAADARTVLASLGG